MLKSPIKYVLDEEGQRMVDAFVKQAVEEEGPRIREQLLSEIAFEIAQEQGLLYGRLHLDTTSLTLYGNYHQALAEGRVLLGMGKQKAENVMCDASYLWQQ